MTNELIKKPRLHYLDVIRGTAIILMTIYHFCFDLDNFQYIQLDMDRDIFWRVFRYMIVSMFLVTMGISLALTHSTGLCWKCLRKRSIFLGGAAILVSIGSYLQFPQSWIYFGILHFILFASWAALPFINQATLSLVTAMIILWGSYSGWLHTRPLFDTLQPLLHLPKGYTEDLVNVFPWFAAVLIGIFVAAMGWHKIPRLSPAPWNQKIAFLGRHALLIYLIHQPLLIGAILVFQYL